MTYHFLLYSGIVFEYHKEKVLAIRNQGIIDNIKYCFSYFLIATLILRSWLFSLWIAMAEAGSGITKSKGFLE